MPQLAEPLREAVQLSRNLPQVLLSWAKDTLDLKTHKTGYLKEKTHPRNTQMKWPVLWAALSTL